jgi:hypothetical protein
MFGFAHTFWWGQLIYWGHIGNKEEKQKIIPLTPPHH